MLQSFKIIIHFIYVAIYIFFLMSFINSDNEYFLTAAKTNDILSAILMGACVVLHILAFVSKKKKYYFYQIIPIILEGVLSLIYSDMSGRYYDSEKDIYIRWSPTYDMFYVMLILYVIFMGLLFVKIKNNGNLWNTLQ